METGHGETLLETIERQAAIIDELNDLVKRQAEALAQVGAVALEEERAAVYAKYEALTGREETT